ncbi:AMP-binding protein [Deinococcus sp.]|uniref:AMP-binding protein n=1 Tax=Deinococcus sp. TaxID=47478 RepID=UPI003C7A3608
MTGRGAPARPSPAGVWLTGIGDLKAALAALRATGLFGPNPLRSVPHLVWCLLRHGVSLYAVVAWNARRWPDRPAVQDSEGAVSFRQLIDQADRAAARLESCTPAASTGLLCRNHAPFVALLLACSRLGLRTVLLNTSFSAEQIRAVCQAQGVSLLLCDDEFRPALEETGLRPLPVSALTAPAPGIRVSALLRPPFQLRLRRRGRASLVLLTSGTTGSPRAVRHSLSPLSLLPTLSALLIQLRPRPGSPTLLTLPLFHGHGLATLGLGLTLAAPLHLFARSGPEDHWRCLREQRIEVLVLAPTILYRLLHTSESGALAADLLEVGTLPALRTVVSGSAPLGAVLAAQARRRFGAALHNLYGSSEAGLISLATPEELSRAPGTVGRVLPGVRVRLQPLEPARGEVTPGQVGRVTVQSGGVCRAGAGGGSQRFFETGDLGWFGADGLLFLAGRQDDLLVIGGENVYPEMIEERLARLPYVLDCAVTALYSAEYGQAVHAHLVLKTRPGDIGPGDIGPGETRLADIERDLRALLPRMLRPARISVVDALPRTPLGKLLRPRIGEPPD